MSVIAWLATKIKIPPWLVELVLLLLVILVFALWERHRGAQDCIRSDQKAVAVRVAADNADYAKGVTTVFQEASSYDAAIHAPVDRPVVARLCKSPGRSATAQDRTTPAGADAGSPLREPSADISVPGPDVGSELLTIGRDADAQIIALQSYIRDVCQATPSPSH